MNDSPPNDAEHSYSAGWKRNTTLLVAGTTSAFRARNNIRLQKEREGEESALLNTENERGCFYRADRLTQNALRLE